MNMQRENISRAFSSLQPARRQAGHRLLVASISSGGLDSGAFFFLKPHRGAPGIYAKECTLLQVYLSKRNIFDLAYSNQTRLRIGYTKHGTVTLCIISRGIQYSIRMKRASLHFNQCFVTTAYSSYLLSDPIGITGCEDRTSFLFIEAHKINN